MRTDDIYDDYVNWLIHTVSRGRFSDDISYSELLLYLQHIKFRYSIPFDQNRAEDGISLRYRFAIMHGYEDFADEVMDVLDGPCSVLEMMLALAIKCEENIMDDPKYGDRTGQWFWGMIKNLGLGSMRNGRFDEDYVDDVIQRFLDRKYEPDGRGGLFTVRDCEYDLREVEIWHQLCWYLDSILHDT